MNDELTCLRGRLRAALRRCYRLRAHCGHLELVRLGLLAKVTGKRFEGLDDSYITLAHDMLENAREHARLQRREKREKCEGGSA